MAKLEELAKAVEAGRAKTAAQVCQEALDEGAGAGEILDAMTGAMGIVGEKFSTGEIFVPEMLASSKAMNRCLEMINPLLAGGEATKLGKCIIGTVKNDLHDIGKNLVKTMIGAAGYEMIDLGVDVPTEKFVEAIEANSDVKIVALSCLLTTTMPSLIDTLKAVTPMRDKMGFKIMVGGAPITQAFADEHGADAYTIDAGAAGIKAKELAN